MPVSARMENLSGPVLWKEYAKISVEDSPTKHQSFLQNFTPYMPPSHGGKHNRQEDTIIHSDSMAAINILSQTKTRTYPEITTKITDSAFALSQRGSLSTLRCLKERADALANEATNLTNILHTEQTPDAYKHMIIQYLHKQITPNQDTAKLSTWYNKTIVPDIHLINNRITDIHIRRLRCWVHTKSFVCPIIKHSIYIVNKTLTPILFVKRIKSLFNSTQNRYLICPKYPTLKRNLVRNILLRNTLGRNILVGNFQTRNVTHQSGYVCVCVCVFTPIG